MCDRDAEPCKQSYLLKYIRKWPYLLDETEPDETMLNYITKS